MTHLFVDALNRLHNLKNNFSEKERCRNLELIKNAEEGFRTYVEAYEERNISMEISPHVAFLTDEEIATISTYLEYRGLFKKYYAKTDSEEFSCLSKNRKANVIRALFDLARELEVISEKLIKTMKSKHKYLKRINETHDELIQIPNNGPEPEKVRKAP